MLHYIWVFPFCQSTHLGVSSIQRVNTEISVFRVTRLKILGRVSTNIFIFSGKKYNFMHFERHFAFQNA